MGMDALPAVEQEVTIDAGAAARLPGQLSIPERARGVVLFAHGSGSSRHSSRNRYVADHLRSSGLGTLLFDLLTDREAAAESATRRLRFDIDLLSERLMAATDWLQKVPSTWAFEFGYFGASTGAAAALVAAAQRPSRVAAVVSRGGRPDLAGRWLGHIHLPTLLIVGGKDVEVSRLNQHAYQKLKGPKQLKSIPGATHLFTEPHALHEMARLAADWFKAHLARPHARVAHAPSA